MTSSASKVGIFLAVAALSLPAWRTALAQGGVSKTLHNLSVGGPGEIRSSTETEVCKFCHIPHSAVVPRPLWGHAVTEVPRYETPAVRVGPEQRQQAPQPDGSSRLCLSCHDGTVALGDLGVNRKPIPMAGLSRLGAERRSFLGTDLSGSHPVSIVHPTSDPAPSDGKRDMALVDRAAVEMDREVPLDQNGKIQCTTCHDPHEDENFRAGEVPHFWRKPTVTETCLTCHDLR